MSVNNAKSAYSAEITTDPDLNTPVVALAYTDPNEPARNLLACIAPALGSNWYRLRAGEQELLHCEPEELKAHGHTGVFVLWPFPNRVRDAQYSYHGQHYTFAGVPRKGALIHGLVFDRSWSYEQPSASQESATVTTFVEMKPDSPYYQSYPFASRLALTYTLTSAGLTVDYSVRNTGTQTLPYGFALHPYFNLLSGGEQTVVTLPADHVMEADKGMLPTGRVLDIHSTMYSMFDLSQPTPINQLKLDHVYTDLPPEHEALIDYRGLNLRMHISASNDFTHAVIYTPAQAPYFCLESQTCSTDAINLAQRGMQDIAHLLEVQPGKEAGGFIRYTVEHKQ